MNSCIRLLIGFAVLLASCTPAKSPLDQDGQNATFAVSPDRVKADAEFDQSGEKTFGQAKVQILHFSVCLQNLISGQPVVEGTPFTIGDGSTGGFDRKTDLNGCLHWDETHSSPAFTPQVNVHVRRTIKGLGNQRGTVGLDFNVRPWLQGVAAVQGEVAHEDFAHTLNASNNFGFEQNYPTEVEASANSPRLLVAGDSFLLEFMGIGPASEYLIDPYLNLAMPYHYSYSFRPLVTRKSLSGETISEPITAGRFRITFVFFGSAKGDPRLDNNYLASAESEVEVQANGQASGLVTVSYPHMLYTSGRQTVLIGIAPVDGSSALGKANFSASVSQYQQQKPLTVFNDERDPEMLHQQKTARRKEIAESRPAPLDQYLQTHDVLRLSTDFLPATKLVAKSWLKRFVEHVGQVLAQDELNVALEHDKLDVSSIKQRKGDKGDVADRLARTYSLMNYRFGKALTADVVRDNYVDVASTIDPVWATDGSMDPYLSDLNSIEVRQLDFMSEPKALPPRDVHTPPGANVDMGVFESMADSSAASLGFALHAPGAFWGMGIPEVTLGYTLARSHAKTSSFGSTMTMGVDLSTVQFEARFTHCVLISKVNKSDPAKPWLICADKPTPRRLVTEQFFFYKQIFPAAGGVRDPYNSEDAIIVLFRGKNHMARETARLSGTDFRNDKRFDVFIHAHVPNLSKWDTMQAVDDLTDQEVPGAIERN